MLHVLCQLLLAIAPLPEPAPARQGQAIQHTVQSDELIGKWLGERGPPEDRNQVGLEIKPDDSGELRASFYQPIMSFFGLDAGPVRVEPDATTADHPTGDHSTLYHVDMLGLTLRLEGDALIASSRNSPDPIRFERVEALPSEAPVPDLPTGPGPRWHAALGSPIFAALSAQNGIAYVGSTGGVLTALRVSDGAIVWTFSAGRPIFGQAALADGALYFVCDNGYLFRLDAATGAETWRYDLGDARVSRILGHPAVFDYDCRSPRPLVMDGTVYVGSGDGSFHAVDAGTGERRWVFQTTARIRAGAAGDERLVYFGGADSAVHALDRSTGAQVWTRDLGGEITSAPALIQGRLIVGTRASSTLFALDPATGETLWRQRFFGSWVESEPAEFDGLIYLGSSDLRRVECFDPVAGTLRWRTDVLGWSWGTPVVTQDRVYAAAGGIDPYQVRHLPGLLALDRLTGRPLWRWVPPPSPGSQHTGFAEGPILIDGVLLIGGLDGSVYAFPVE